MARRSPHAQIYLIEQLAEAKGLLTTLTNSLRDSLDAAPSLQVISTVWFVSTILTSLPLSVA